MSTMPEPPAGRRSMPSALRWSIYASLFVMLVFVAWLVGDATLEPATWALSAAGVALMHALFCLHRMVEAMARPSARAIIARELASDRADRRVLLEERRRLLRAIKELEFDHALGKLSDEDFAPVRERYQLRAIEVMRALDQGQSLHPGLEVMLETMQARPSEQTKTPKHDGTERET